MLLVEFVMNSTSSEAMGFTPFEVNYGWMPHIIHRVDFNTPRPGVKQFVQDITNMLDKTFDRLLTQRTGQAMKTNCHRRDGQDFKEGDLGAPIDRKHQYAQRSCLQAMPEVHRSLQSSQGQSEELHVQARALAQLMIMMHTQHVSQKTA